MGGYVRHGYQVVYKKDLGGCSVWGWVGVLGVKGIPTSIF